jgi:hypothetical protein
VEHVLPASIERLHSWLLGLPWVVERPGMAEAPGLRWFAVDCAPLGRRRLWLLTGALDGIPINRPVVHVVLPTPTAHCVARAHSSSVVSAIVGGHDLVSIPIDDDQSPDDAGLQHVLLLGYEASLA